MSLDFAIPRKILNNLDQALRASLQRAAMTVPERLRHRAILLALTGVAAVLWVFSLTHPRFLNGLIHAGIPLGAVFCLVLCAYVIVALLVPRGRTMRPREHFLAIAMGVILVLGFAFWWKTAMSTNKPVGPMFFPLLLMFCIGAVAPAALIMALGMRFFWLLATTVVLLIAFGIVKFVLYCPKGVLGGVGFLMFAISSLAQLAR